MIRYNIIILQILLATTFVLGQECPVNPDASCLGCTGNPAQPTFTEMDAQISANLCNVTLDWTYVDEGNSSARMVFTCSYDDGSLCPDGEMTVCASCGTVSFNNLNTVINPEIVYSDTCGNVDAFVIGENCHPIITTTQHPEGCKRAFKFIGNRCIFIDPFFNGTWDEARFFCSELGGAELVSIDNDVLYMDILDYIYEFNLEREDYWVGGVYSIATGLYHWLNGSPMEMGTPYWAVYGVGANAYLQEPTQNGTGDYTCVQMEKNRYLYYDDDDCQLGKAMICEHF